MKLNQERLALIGLITGILVLGGALVWLLLQEQRGVSLPRSFARDFHQALVEEKTANQALVEDIDELPVPDENRTVFFLLQNVAREYQRELEWIGERETESFTVLDQSENNLAIQEALANEIGYYVLFNYLREVNMAATEAVGRENTDVEEIIARTEQELIAVTSIAFAPNEQLRALAREAGLSESALREKINTIAEAFWEYKKNRFQIAVTRFEKAAIGQQLLIWKYIFEVIAPSS